MMSESILAVTIETKPLSHVLKFTIQAFIVILFIIGC